MEDKIIFWAQKLHQFAQEYDIKLKFIKACKILEKEHPSSIYDIFKLIVKNHFNQNPRIDNIFMASFVWDRTEEGDTFWCSVHSNWQKYTSEIKEPVFEKIPFKVGDQVKIRSYSEISSVFNDRQETNGVFFDSSMKRYCGDICTITKDLGENRFKTTGNMFSWSDQWLELKNESVKKFDNKPQKTPKIENGDLIVSLTDKEPYRYKGEYFVAHVVEGGLSNSVYYLHSGINTDIGTGRCRTEGPTSANEKEFQVVAKKGQYTLEAANWGNKKLKNRADAKIEGIQISSPFTPDYESILIGLKKHLASEIGKEKSASEYLSPPSKTPKQPIEIEIGDAIEITVSQKRKYKPTI